MDVTFCTDEERQLVHYMLSAIANKKVQLDRPGRGRFLNYWEMDWQKKACGCPIGCALIGQPELGPQNVMLAVEIVKRRRLDPWRQNAWEILLSEAANCSVSFPHGMILGYEAVDPAWHAQQCATEQDRAALRNGVLIGKQLRDGAR